MRHGLTEASSQSTLAHLPAELGFLLGRGFALDELQRIAVESDRTGVSGDRLLLTSNVIDEIGYYRALALELGLPFTRHGRVSARARFPESVQAGLAPLAGSAGGFLMAPQGLALVALLTHRRLPREGLVVTTPSALLRAVMETKSLAISHQASHALPSWRPDLSSRDGWDRSQLVVLCLIILMLTFSTTFGLHMPVAGLAIAASPLFLGMVVTRLSACLLPNPVQASVANVPAPDRNLPSYTIIAALYREAAITRKLISALDAIQYPRAKLEVLIVIEADDHETREALAAVDLPGHMKIIRAPPGFPRTKPRALNVALPLARGEFTVVFDAEDEPDKDQLRIAAAFFAKLPSRVACLQARLTIDNMRDTWLTRMFTIEYATLFDVFNPGLASLGSPILLGGTSNHFRTAVLQKICGWDAWNVTEDADLGIRLSRMGYEVADLPSSTLEEAPATLPKWMKQRTRWMKGYMQTCISHSRTPVEFMTQLGPWRAYGAATVTFGTVLSALGYPFFTAFSASLWWRQPGSSGDAALWAFSSTLFAVGIAAIYVPAIVALKRRRLWELLPWTLLLPLYFLLVSIAAWRGLWELIWTPFWWNKTEHGLARTTRKPPSSETPGKSREDHVVENGATLAPP